MKISAADIAQLIRALRENARTAPIRVAYNRERVARHSLDSAGGKYELLAGSWVDQKYRQKVAAKASATLRENSITRLLISVKSSP